MWAAIAAVIPLLLKVIELIFAAPSDKRSDVAAEINKKLSEIRSAIKKSQESGGDTSELEKILRGKP